MLEVLSDQPGGEDPGGKFGEYEDIGISGYFICDPWSEPMAVWGCRLMPDGYLKIEPAGNGRTWSESLQAWLGADADGLFRIWDAAGRPMPR